MKKKQENKNQEMNNSEIRSVSQDEIRYEIEKRDLLEYIKALKSDVNFLNACKKYTQTHSKNPQDDENNSK